jgi:acyl-CoA synthetase (AMP-forming)/AMP-acid ligase II
VVLRPAATVEVAELCEWTNAQLAAYQRVATMEFRETLPRNQLGKLLKRDLREPYWNGRPGD